MTNTTLRVRFGFNNENASQASRLIREAVQFILFTRKDGDLEKSVRRPHQMRAVERSVERAKEPDKRRGLIWHTQGCAADRPGHI